MIFRPWSAGTAVSTTLYCGFSNDFSAGSPTNQLAWQYSTNQAPTNVWNFRQDGATVNTATGLAQGVNDWFKITLVRTSNLTYTTTIQDITAGSTIYSYSGTVAASNLILYMGWQQTKKIQLSTTSHDILGPFDILGPPRIF